MTMNGNGLAGIAAGHAETLQRELASTPRNSTVRDLCRRFLQFLRNAYPQSDVDLLYRGPGNDQWIRIDDDTPSPMDGNGKDTPGTSVFELVDAGLRATCNLGDGGTISIRIGSVPPVPLFSELDLVSLRLYVSLLDVASRSLLTRQTEKSLVFSLNHRVLQLTSLIDTGIEVSRLDAGTSPHLLALERAASLTNASRGLLLIDREGKGREVFGFPHAADAVPGPRPGNHIVSTFSFHNEKYTFQLFDKESRNSEEGFDDTDQMILDALVRQVHASLENRFLHAQSLEKQRIEQDIAVAASIQQRILPATLPQVEGYDLAGINIPSKSVGGDYYDCIPLSDDRYALVIADVSGKGVPAALLVSSLHAYLSAYLESPISLENLARRLNRVIWNASTDDKFITAFLALLTPSTGELVSVNAGHTPGYLLRKSGAIQELTSGGLPFGMLELDLPYATETVMLEPGDRLLLYTDGVTEAMNEGGELYDAVKPFKDFYAMRSSETAQHFIDALISDMKAFMGRAPQNDDITAMYVLRA